MIVVAVRNFEDKKLLGFFWAVNHDELWWAVDAIGEPSAYEWARLGSGRLYYPDEERDMSDIILSDEPEDPGEEPPDEDQDYSLDGLHIHEYTWGDLNVGTRWKRFDYATEGHGGIASLKRKLDRDETNDD